MRMRSAYLSTIQFVHRLAQSQTQDATTVPSETPVEAEIPLSQDSAQEESSGGELIRQNGES